MEVEAEMAQCGHKPRLPGAARSWERQEGPSPGACGGSEAVGHLDLRLPASTTRENTCLSFSSPVVVCDASSPGHQRTDQGAVMATGQELPKQ